MNGTNGTEHELSAAKDDLISAALVSGASYRQAAEAAGVARSTVGRRMQDPTFRSSIEYERVRALHRAGRRLGEITEMAVETYAEVLESEEATVGQRLKAADAVLATFRSISSDLSIANRLQAIEERLTNAEDEAASSSF